MASNENPNDQGNNAPNKKPFPKLPQNNNGLRPSNLANLQRPQHPHGHRHGDAHYHGVGGHTHDSSERFDADVGGSLLQYIDSAHIECLNEAEEGSCKKLIKPHDKMTDFEGDGCISDDGKQLMLKIPFTDLCHLRAFQVLSRDVERAPLNCKLYKDSETLDFDSVEDAEPDQVFSLCPDSMGHIFYTVKVHKFRNVGHLTMFFNYEEDEDEDDEDGGCLIDYVGIQGEWSVGKARAVHTLYESKARPVDHKNTATDEKKTSSKMGF